MKKQTKNGVTYLTFDNLSRFDSVAHGFSTRLGGVSSGVYESMNLGLNRGDERSNVEENYRRICSAIGIDYSRLCFSQQTHTVNIKIVGEEDAGNGLHHPLPYTDVDALITDVKNLPLVTFYADCVPLFIYDPVGEVIALAHSGWRGTVGSIGSLVIEKMTEVYGTEPSDVIACIGPSICGDCYEVSEDVAAAFRKKYSEKKHNGHPVTPILRPSLFHPGDDEKFMLNLWEACRQNFIETGVREENIEITDYCTRCNPDLFYSHRIMGNERGSLAAFMSLK